MALPAFFERGALDMGHHKYALHLRTDLDRHQDLHVELGSDQFDFLARFIRVRMPLFKQSLVTSIAW